MHALAAAALLAVAASPEAPPVAPVVLDTVVVAADGKVAVRPIPVAGTLGIGERIPVVRPVEVGAAPAGPAWDDGWLDDPLFVRRLNPAELRLFESWLPSLDWDKVEWDGGTGWVGEEDSPAQEPEGAEE
jgi:hypothetical protein